MSFKNKRQSQIVGISQNAYFSVVTSKVKTTYQLFYVPNRVGENTSNEDSSTFLLPSSSSQLTNDLFICSREDASWWKNVFLNSNLGYPCAQG
jgi:hypothetical protein